MTEWEKLTGQELQRFQELQRQMEKKYNPIPINYQAEGLDEKVIDEILSRFRLDQNHRLIIGPFSLNDYFDYDPMTREEIEEFEKLPPPPKKVRAAGPYDDIIRKLSALIGNKNLSDDHRLNYAEDLDYYKARQKEARPPAKKKMKLTSIIRDQVRDLVAYIKTTSTTRTLEESFDLAARIWNVKRNCFHFQTAATAKNHYWNTY